jgi:hypothetical protein
MRKFFILLTMFLAGIIFVTFWIWSAFILADNTPAIPNNLVQILIFGVGCICLYGWWYEIHHG